VLQALLRVRIALTTDVPAIFYGTVEVDETYLGELGGINGRL